MADCILCGKRVRGFRAAPYQTSRVPVGYTGVHDVSTRPVHEACARQEGCEHERTRNLYDQRPPSEGRKLLPVRRLCEDCGAVLPHGGKLR